MPADAGCAANVALRLTSGRGVQHAQAVRADQPHTRSAAHREQFALPVPTLPAGLAKPGRDHQQRPHPRVRALAGHVDDPRGRHDHHRQVHRRRDLPDGAVGREPLQRVGMRVDGYSAPLNPPAIRLCKISPPIVPRRRDAPTTATERGARNRLTAATAAVRSRSSKRSIAAGDSDVGSSISIASRVLRRSIGNPLWRNTSIIRWLAGSTWALKRGDAASVGDGREMREHDRRDSPSLPGVGDQERHLGPCSSIRTYEAWATIWPGAPVSATSPNRSA